jgi:predicted metal-binding protein
MPERKRLELLFEKHGFSDYRWIDPASIVVAQWVRMKCLYGCPNYGKSAVCPPHTPAVAECERFFREYKTAAVFHFEKAVDRPEDRHDWSRGINLRLLDMEREVFLGGYVKAFLMFMDTCAACAACSESRSTCKDPKRARPSADAMAVDVYSTVLRAGYPIEVLSDYKKTMNRYAFLLIE